MYTLSLAANNVSLHTSSAAAAVVAVAVAMVVVNELEQNLSSDFRYCLITPKTVKTCCQYLTHNMRFSFCLQLHSKPYSLLTHDRPACKVIAKVSSVHATGVWHMWISTHS
jgi:hypothetical protein